MPQVPLFVSSAGEATHEQEARHGRAGAPGLHGVDPGDTIGFVYTAGLHAMGKPELFADQVPRAFAEQVGRAMNYFADVGMPGEAFISSGLCFTTKELKAPTELLQSKMCKCDEGAHVIQLATRMRNDITYAESAVMAQMNSGE